MSAPYWYIHYMTLEYRASSEPAVAELVEVEVHHERQRVQRLRMTPSHVVCSTAGAAFVVGSSTLRAQGVQRLACDHLPGAEYA